MESCSLYMRYRARAPAPYHSVLSEGIAYGAPRKCAVLSRDVQGRIWCYGMSGTAVGYSATRRVVLRSGMVLRSR
eukprot:820570-Rhodomonas_salina.2